MSDMSHWPPLVGKQRRQYLARCFGSVDGTASGIANRHDRRRFKARIRLEESYAELWQADAGRFCETAEDVERAKTAAHHSIAELEAFHRNALKRPVLLHGGLMAKFIEPFGENDQMPLDAYCTIGSAHEAPVSAMRARIPEARAKYVAFRAWSSDETPEGVPAKWRKQFDASMEYQREGYEEALEDVCRHYGSESGRRSDIPATNHAAAACYWRRWQARQEMRCEFELELLRIDTDQWEAEQAAEARKRAVRAIAAYGFG